MTHEIDFLKKQDSKISCCPSPLFFKFKINLYCQAGENAREKPQEQMSLIYVSISATIWQGSRPSHHVRWSSKTSLVLLSTLVYPKWQAHWGLWELLFFCHFASQKQTCLVTVCKWKCNAFSVMSVTLRMLRGVHLRPHSQDDARQRHACACELGCTHVLSKKLLRQNTFTLKHFILLEHKWHFVSMYCDGHVLDQLLFTWLYSHAAICLQFTLFLQCMEWNPPPTAGLCS